MKKMLVATGVALTAVFANAAVCNWDAEDLYTHVESGTSTELASGYVAYLIDAAVLAPTAVIDAINDKNGNGFSAVTSAGAVADYPSLDGYLEGNDVGNYTGESLTAYLIVFDNSDIKKAKFAYVTETQTKNIPTSGLPVYMDTWDLSASANSANWSAVPEPTSGLLMLLGMAGLALRRRRA